MVDRGLAAQRRIDLRDHRGRNLHQRHATHVGRRSKAGQVADHAAAQREHGAAPIEFRRDKRVVNALQRSERFALLARRDLQGSRREARRLERGDRALAIEARDVGIGYDQTRVRQRYRPRARVACQVERAGADMHRMRVGAEFYAESAHR